MKLLRLTWRPAGYVRLCYGRQPDASALPYDAQKRWLFSDFWGTADGWSAALGDLGHEASDHVIGIPALSDAWYNQLGKSPSSMGSFALDLVRHERPDVLVLEGVERFTLAWVKSLRSALAPSALLVGVSGFEVDIDGPIVGLDAFFTCRPDLAKELNVRGMNACHLPHAFDPRIIAAMGTESGARQPFGFIGSILPGARMHDARRNVIERLAKRFDFPIYSPAERSAGRAAARYVVRAGAMAVGRMVNNARIRLPDHALTTRLKTASQWREVPKFEYISGLAHRMQPPVFGLEMYRVLRSFGTTVNVQPGLSNQHATNVRLFEATGVGTCLLTDRSVDIGDYFSDDEVVTFGTIDEAVERATFLIENPKAAFEIGARGQRRTLAAHTYKERMARVIDHLTSVQNSNPRSHATL